MGFANFADSAKTAGEIREGMAGPGLPSAKFAIFKIEEIEGIL